MFSLSSQFATHSLRTNKMAMNGTATPTARLTANALALLMEEKPDSATFQPVLQIAGTLLCVANESLSHSFSLSLSCGSFLSFSRVLWSFCRPRPRVLITRATTAKDGDGDDRRHCVSLFLFRLSLSLARARIAWGDLKSRLVVRFLKK